EKLSIWWMIAAYIILTVGEVLLYGTGLELAYTAAPSNMKSFITACFLVTNALANFANIGFTSLYGGSLVDPVEKRGPVPPGQFFAIGVVIALLAGFAFSIICRRLGQTPEAEAAPSAA